MSGVVLPMDIIRPQSAAKSTKGGHGGVGTTSVAAFPQINSSTHHKEQEPVNFISAPATQLPNTNCAPLDYSKRRVVQRMSPEGQVQPQSVSPCRVPTKGMMKAYPEQFVVVSQNNALPPYRHSPQSLPQQLLKNIAVSSSPAERIEHPGKMEQAYHHHQLTQHHPPPHPQQQQPVTYNTEPSYYPTPPPHPPHYNNNNDPHMTHLHHSQQLPPHYQHHQSRFSFNYDQHPQHHPEDIREYECEKCALIFSREYDLQIHYSQDHGYGQNSRGGSSASSNSSGSGGNLHSNHGTSSRAPSSSRSSSHQDMFCEKCQLRFNCFLSFRVHQHEHQLPNVQPHYPMSNSHLLSLSYTCEICGANFMSRESLTDHCNAHLFEHVCSESTCGESDQATNSSEAFFQSQLHPSQLHHSAYQHHVIVEEDHPGRHPHLQQQHLHHHEQVQYQPGMKSEDEHHTPHHGSHHPHLIGNQGPNNTPYSPEYSTPPPPPYHHAQLQNFHQQQHQQQQRAALLDQPPPSYQQQQEQQHSQKITPPPPNPPPGSNKIPPPSNSGDGGGGDGGHPSNSSLNAAIYEPLIVMDNGKRRFQCVICKKYLSSRIAHEEHTRGKHTGDKPYSCSYCGKRFAVWNTYKHHMGTHKGGVTPLQKCAMCEKRFKTIECLRNHMQREHNYGGVPPTEEAGRRGRNEEGGNTQGGGGAGANGGGGYSCQICGKTFVRKMWRTRHYLSHTGQNCFRCELCSCILPDEQSYRLHHESHKVSN